MLTFSPTQLEQLSQDTFFNLLKRRIAEIEGATVTFSSEDQSSLWTAAKQAAAFGITSIRGCLILCHIHWEMGLDCLKRIPAFAEIVRDDKASEGDKVEALWLMRTQVFAALREA